MMTEPRRSTPVPPPPADDDSPWPEQIEEPPLYSQNGTPPLEEGPDPFDPETLRLPHDLSAALGAKKALVMLPVRKPAKEWFVRVHDNPVYHLKTFVLELKEVRELYLISPHLWEDLAGESTVTPKMLFLTVNRQGVLFFWPVRLPGPDGRVDTWSKSALEAAELAMRSWIRVVPDASLGGYDVWQAEYPTDPVWPDLSMRTLLRIAFKEHFIDSYQHPILRQLRGEI